MASHGLGGFGLNAGLGFCLLLASATAGAQTPGDATAAPPESDTARVLRYTRALETAPDRADAPELRRWLTQWAIKTPDYTLAVCDLLDFGDAGGDAVPHADELLMQMIYGNAAFQIEAGGEADELSTQVAAVESALRAYAAFVARDAKARVARLDALIAKRDAGALRAYLAPRVEQKCRDAAPTASNGAAAAPEPSKQAFLGGFLRQSHVVYPLRSGGWEMQAEKRYDQQEAGASVRFERAGDDSGWIDVFFYPVGVSSDADTAKMADAERRALLDTWGKSMAGPQDMTALSRFSVPIKHDARAEPASGSSAADDDIAAYALDFAYVRDGKALSSAMVFAIDRMYAIKFRYSAETAKYPRARVRQDLEAFARDMLTRLDIGSSGGCWSPPPVETLAKGAPVPQKAMATTSVKGEAVAWVLSDRVVMRDPSQADAAKLQTLAMFLQGRLYRGCTGAEPSLPEVKDGMRELRFEYRSGESAPADRPSSGAVRSRAG
ncbi:hypothetical protein K4L06_20745 [Lysobacter sp. BMK333-48F3]|uniref:hypothetical protein n=1 Tax=Lysobacter sp. BMK333-48F3 TaxID=2867962 RepID=UPI001C8BF1D1|nr:hypothetical protein [Lysobacter sp. BMK333-48F3]MBX9403742.1 hypothetical protein [Lysobacter sp. BMK333-48F3]